MDRCEYRKEDQNEGKEGAPHIDWGKVKAIALAMLKGDELPALPSSPASPLAETGFHSPRVLQATLRRWLTPSRAERFLGVLVAQGASRQMLWRTLWRFARGDGVSLTPNQHRLVVWEVLQDPQKEYAEEVYARGPFDPLWDSFSVSVFTTDVPSVLRIEVKPRALFSQRGESAGEASTIPTPLRLGRTQLISLPTNLPDTITQAVEQVIAWHRQRWNVFCLKPVDYVRSTSETAAQLGEKQGGEKRKGADTLQSFRSVVEGEGKEKHTQDPKLRAAFDFLQWIWEGAITAEALPSSLAWDAERILLPDPKIFSLWKALVLAHEADHRLRPWELSPEAPIVLQESVDVRTLLTQPFTLRERWELLKLFCYEKYFHYIQHPNVEPHFNVAEALAPRLPAEGERLEEIMALLAEAIQAACEGESPSEETFLQLRLLPETFRLCAQGLQGSPADHSITRILTLDYLSRPTEIMARLVQALAWLGLEDDKLVSPDHLRWCVRTYPEVLDNSLLRLLRAAEAKPGGLEKLAELANRYGV